MNRHFRLSTFLRARCQDSKALCRPGQRTEKVNAPQTAAELAAGQSPPLLPIRRTSPSNTRKNCAQALKPRQRTYDGPCAVLPGCHSAPPKKPSSIQTGL